MPKKSSRYVPQFARLINTSSSILYASLPQTGSDCPPMAKPISASKPAPRSRSQAVRECSRLLFRLRDPVRGECEQNGISCLRYQPSGVLLVEMADTFRHQPDACW